MIEQIQTKNKVVEKKRYLAVKRFFDIFITILGMPFILLLILIFGLWVKLDTKGPIFYKQERLGKNGKEFHVYKLRSMTFDAESKTGAVWAQKNDPRVTKAGTFIRKTRIDELPQFFNVLLGDMSIIGPRPERKIFSEEFSKKIPQFPQRLVVKPGITGLAQVSGGYDLTPEEKLAFDLSYINNLSLANDVKIFIKTFSVIFTGSGAR